VLWFLISMQWKTSLGDLDEKEFIIRYQEALLQAESVSYTVV
jgi:hypothetical protein